MEPLVKGSDEAQLRIVDLDLESLLVCERVRYRVLEKLRLAKPTDTW